MRKVSAIEEILGFKPLAPHERTEIPGTVAWEGEEFIYFADDGSGDFARLFDLLTQHNGRHYAKTGSRGEERCKVFTPDNMLFYAIGYKGDLEGWRKDIELGAKAHNITLAWIKGEDFILSDGRSYKLSECKAEFY